ncbi:lactadherin-like [Montipora foliosa]|uniref:lactadherin-like n=1 Tax=Montipora foliosa TaxID=591990 RepID=UPI0035F1FE89
MNFAVLSLPIYLLVRSEFASSCTATYSVQGQVLQNHTINAETADKIGDCILRCMAYPGCTSSNFYRKNKRCELSDKTHASHPDDMRHEPYTIYMVNTFRTIPCKTHSDCGVYLICAPSLACEECRSAPLGMESRAIQDSAVTASSTWDSRLQPWQARINNELCWSAGTSVIGEWLQVDLGKDTAVTKVATQGRSTGGQWVKSYKILFSLDEANWNEYQIGGVVKVFRANSDVRSIVSHKLVPRITSRYIRFSVLSWRSYISMRVELYGCAKGL